MRRCCVLALLLVLLVLVAASCSDERSPSAGSTTTTSTSTTSTTAPPPPDPELLAAGDIADCKLTADTDTAALVESRPNAVVAAVGDLAYPSGTVAQFRDCYGPTWGRFKARTHPAPGNHEYGRGQARDYFAYWGTAAGPTGKGWYSYDLGAWHVVVLNSTCGPVACGADSEQVRWLTADLAAHRTACALAYWHHPRWSSGLHGSQPQVDALWRAAVAGGVDVVLSGHDHHYERFALRDGARQFVVGTGGATMYPVLNTEVGSEVHQTGTPGLLSLRLHATSYDWEFLSVAGAATPFTDKGSTAC